MALEQKGLCYTEAQVPARFSILFPTCRNATGQFQSCATYPNFVILCLVFKVLIKFFLRIKLNPVDFQFFANLGRKTFQMEKLCKQAALQATRPTGVSSPLPAYFSDKEILTLCLNSIFSSRVMVSALAMTGMMFTTLLKCFINSISKGRKLWSRRKTVRNHCCLYYINARD